jgi:hypothetical protein
MTTALMPNLAQLTDAQLGQAWSDGAIDLETLTRECDRRESAEKRSASARAAGRRRHSEWEAAAYAQYEAVLALGWSSGLLSEAGKRKGREPWPMLWQGNEQDARLLASDEVLRYWDHIEARIPPPAQYAAAKRAAAAEHEARSEPEPAPRVIPVPTYRPPVVPVPSYRPPTAPKPAGSIARYITALGVATRATETSAARILAARRSLESYPKASVRGTK